MNAGLTAADKQANSCMEARRGKGTVGLVSFDERHDPV